MKKLALSLAFVVALAFSASTVKAQNNNQQPATTPAPNPNAAVMTFEKDTINYGTIAHNSDGYRYFKFTNTGKEPLIITEAHGSCGCTIPTWPKEPIQPGQSSEIKVHYATDRVGMFTKTVTVTSNANPSSKVLYIKGNVLPDPTPAQGTNGTPAPTPATTPAPVK